MNVLLVGNGAREHAVAERFTQSSQLSGLFSYMKANNPGIAELSKEIMIGPYDDPQSIVDFAKQHDVQIAFIGPEDPLNQGVADALEEAGIPTVGPKKQLAQLETSKSFTRHIVQKYNIPGNPKYKQFADEQGIQGFLDELEEVVIKPDGLTGGKGVKVQGDHFQTKQEALEYCREVLQTHPAVVVEEKLDGEEFSLQCLTDGITVKATPPAQDHKRAFNDDKGPNTGGMGSYTDNNHLLPFLKKEDVQAAIDITQQVCNALREELGERYKGVMYGGFIVTKNGVKLIEYNARFGDPEAMNVLPILKTDFIDICKAINEGTLKDLNLEFQEFATVCKYAVPEGYPTNPVKDQKVEIGQIPQGVKLYYASVDKKEDGLYMSSSRAIAVVGIDQSITLAQEQAEKAMQNISGPIFHRTDIGTASLIQKRIDHMKVLRDEE